jgi:superfamily I DNA and/or RNA helicase
MSALVQEFLQAWESELLQLRSNDPLIDLTGSPYICSENELWDGNTNGRQLLKEFKRIERERGVLAMVKFDGLLTWKKGDKTIKTPVFLHECIGFNSQQEKLEFEQNSFLNPFLSLEMKKALNLDFQDKERAEVIDQFLNTTLFLSFEPTEGYANLHPQRYELRKEWEALKQASQFSAALHQIIGDVEVVSETEQEVFISNQIGPLDPDQRAAVAQVKTSSSVIYGPPGTGKSVVLSTIMAQALEKGQSALVVSDKPVALEVLVGKLTQHQLDQFCILLPDSQTLAPFYKRLQQQFEHLLQSTNQDAVQFQNDFLAQKYWMQRQQIEKLTGIPFHQLRTQFEPVNNAAVRPTKRWLSWLLQQKELEQIDVDTRKILGLLQQYWQEASAQALDQDWAQWNALYRELNTKQHLHSISELHLFVTQSLRCLQFQAGLYQTYGVLLDKEPEVHLKRLQQYQQINAKQAHLNEVLQVWKQIPTLKEWEVLQQAANTSGWLAKRRWRNLEKNWLRLPGLELKALETNLKKYWRSQEQKAQIIEKFANLGIADLEEASGLLIPLLKQHNASNWSWYRSLSSTEIQYYCQHHQIAHQLQQLHHQLFTPRAADFKLLQHTIASKINALIEKHSFLQQIPFELWEGCSDLNQLQQDLRNEFWADLRNHFPDLYAHSASEIRPLIEKDLKKETEIWQQNARQLIAKQYQNFQDLQQLLVAPLHQLTAEQKEQRQNLRKGKAILVKEMAKSRQHLSIAALFESHAAPWLRAVFPIWLATPTALAKRLPMQQALFDIGIFDEASQLPLSHAVGALQRVSKLVVAGDPQQMRPQSYFGQSAEGVVDLLHQAAFYLPSKHLRHHYRSEDPSLIEFSNQHFYDNALVVWPSKTDANSGLFDHYIQDGCYEQQQNKREAQALANQLKSQLQSTQKFGVVAFSEAQLNCIYQELNVAEQALLEQRIQERSAFFLALEQVQGEECEILLISFGYAKNEAQQFSLKLGPMTQTQSGRRLNVLLTRAQKSLHFYSSVRAADFPSKRSAATNKLWEWFVFLENNKISQAAHNADERLAAATDYPTFLNYYRVLKQRQTLPNQV